MMTTNTSNAYMEKTMLILKRKKISMLMGVILGGASLVGCGGQESSANTVAAAKIEASVSHAARLNANQDHFATLKVTNVSQAHLDDGIAAQCPSVTLDKVSLEGNQSGSIEAKLAINGAVGAGKQCTDGQSFATLACGQSCEQTINISGDDRAFIAGNVNIEYQIDDTLMAGAQTTNASGAVKAPFEVSTAVPQNSPLIQSVKPTLFPNANVEFVLHNSSDYDYENVQILLSQALQSNFFRAISNVKNASYDYGQALIVGTIPAGETVAVSFDLSGIVAGQFTASDFQAALANNSENYISIVGSNIKTETPMLRVFGEPYYLSMTNIHILKPTSVLLKPHQGALPVTIQSIDVSNLPYGVTISDSSSCKVGAKLQGAAGCDIQLDLASDATTELGGLTVQYSSNGRDRYTQTLQVSVDNTTTLTNNESIVAMRMNEKGQPRLTPFKITNGGNFDIQVPQDINQLLTITGPDVSGLSLVNTCGATMLKPKQSCNIQIKSDNPSTELGNYQISVIGYQNVKPSHLASFSLQPSLADLEVAERTQIPALIDETKTAQLIMDITNTGGSAITLSAVTLPNNTGSLVGLNIGDSLAPNETKRVVYMLSKTTGQADIKGRLLLNFNQGEYLWQSTNINAEFVPYEALPKDQFHLSGDTVLKPNGRVEFVVKNTSQQRLHRLAMDLSAMPESLYQHIQAFEGGIKQGKSVVFEEDLLPSDTHVFSFTLDADSADVLKTYLNEILNNHDSHIIAITTVGTQSAYPALTAQVTPLAFSASQIEFSQAGEVLLEVANLTNATFKLSLQNLPDGVAAHGCAVLAANSTCVLTFVAEDSAPMQNANTIIHIEDITQQLSYDYDLNIKVGGTSLNKISPDYIQLPRMLENGRPTITNVTLRNTGQFDLMPVTSLSDMFTIIDADTMQPIENEKLEIVDGTIGQSCIGGVPRHGQCVIGIQSNDPHMDKGKYLVVMSQVGNLVITGDPANQQFEFELTDNFNDYALTVTSPLPDYIIERKEGHYKAELTSHAQNPFHIDDITLPIGDVVFSDDAVGAGYNCWNGSQGAILEEGQNCYIDFTLKAGGAGTSFAGPFDLHLRDTVTQNLHDLRVTEFDVSIVDDEYAQNHSVAMLDASDFIFSPGRDAMLELRVKDDHVLNNAIIDMSAMPVELRDQIYTVKLNNKTYGFDDNGVISFGTLRSGDYQIIIEMTTTAEAALAQHKNELENNPTHQWIKIDAANMNAVAPVALVSLAPLVQFDHQQVRFDQPYVPFKVEVINDSQFAYNITGVHQTEQLMKSLYASGADISIDESDCIGALNEGDSCEISVIASPSAYGTYHFEMSYTDAMGNDFTSPIGIEVSATSAKLQVPQVVQKAADEVVFNVQVQNNGLFNLHAVTTVGDGLILSDGTDIQLTGNGSCYQATELAPNQACTAEIRVLESAPLQDDIKVSLQAQAFSNLDHGAEYYFDVIGKPNLITQVLDDNGNWETVTVIPVRASNSEVRAVKVLNNGVADATLRDITLDLALPSGLQKPVIHRQSCLGDIILQPGDDCIFELEGRGANEPINADPSYQGNIVISYDDLESQQAMIDIEYQIPYMFKSIEVGKSLVGATRCAVDASNAFVCWGDNQYGQIGVGKVYDYEKSPQVVSIGDRFDPLKVSAYSVGDNNVCAASNDENEPVVSCWGRNDMGQSGIVRSDGSTCKAMGGESVLCKPNLITEDSTTPTRFGAKDISTNGGTACIIDPSNVAICWGALVGSANPEYTDIHQYDMYKFRFDQVVVTVGATFFSQVSGSDKRILAMNNYDKYNTWAEASDMPDRKMIAANFDPRASGGNICIIDDQNVLRCRGSNVRGELGIGSTEEVYEGSYFEPLSVNGFNVHNVKKVSVGQGYMCALDNSKNLYCWGDNQYGQLGLGTDVAYSSVPQRVTNANGFKSNDVIDVSVGIATTCAITGDYQLYCWGKSPLESSSADVNSTSNVPLPIQRPQ